MPYRKHFHEFGWRKAANKVLEHLGGAGAVNEAVRYVIKLNGKVQEE